MNNIEAVEGIVKSVLTRLCQVFCEDRLDDTEYIRNVKAVLEATTVYLKSNEESFGDSKSLELLFYTFSKELWLKNLKNTCELPDSDIKDTADEESSEYSDYYYDYIYHHGVYPQ